MSSKNKAGDKPPEEVTRRAKPSASSEDKPRRAKPSASSEDKPRRAKPSASSGGEVGFPVAWPWLVAMAVYYIGATVVTHHHKPAGTGAVVMGLLVFIVPIGRLLRYTLLGAWKRLNEESRLAAAENASDHFDYRPLVVLVTTAVTLTLIEYYGDRDMFRIVVNRWAPSFTSHHYYDLCAFGYWTGCRVLGYVIIPWLTVLAMPGERLRDYGLKTTGFLRHIWIYGVLYAIVLVPVVMVSYTKAFQRIYPFYKLAPRSWTDFLSWEALYGLQFFALEVFFRGYMLHPLKRPMGAYAVFTMAVPYCMIHYNKHITEVLGAVAAGIVLGTLSLSTGSIWCGVLVHVSVALSMDGLSLFHTAGYPGNPRLVL